MEGWETKGETNLAAFPLGPFPRFDRRSSGVSIQSGEPLEVDDEAVGRNMDCQFLRRASRDTAVLAFLKRRGITFFS
jgi:hypothetical protein